MARRRVPPTDQPGVVSTRPNAWDVLRIRLEAAKEAQKRSRLAFVVSIIASLSFVTAAWNSYVSWERKFAMRVTWDENEVTEELQKEAVRKWVDSQVIRAPVLGIQIGISDAAPLGAAALFTITIWFYVCRRRETRTILGLLRETEKNGTNRDEKRAVFHGIVEYSLFTVFSRGARYGAGSSERQCGDESFMNLALSVLLYLPVLTIVALIYFDVRSLLDPALFRFPHTPLFEHLGASDVAQFAFYETAAIIGGVLTAFLCKRIDEGEKRVAYALEDYWNPEIDVSGGVATR